MPDNFKNRKRLMRAGNAACYHCCNRFASADIVDWVDRGQTPLCPHCGIDAVIPIFKDMLGSIDNDVLQGLQHYYFHCESQIRPLVIPVHENRRSKDLDKELGVSDGVEVLAEAKAVDRERDKD